MADHALLAVTETALQRIRGFRLASADLADAALTVAVTGVSAGEYTVALSLEPRARPQLRDSVEHLDDLVIVVAADSVERVRGATIDWSDAPPTSSPRPGNSASRSRWPPSVAPQCRPRWAPRRDARRPP